MCRLPFISSSASPSRTSSTAFAAAAWLCGASTIRVRPRSMPACFAISSIFAAGPDEDRRDQSRSAGLDRAGQRRLLARMRDRGRDGLEARDIAPAAARTFPFPVLDSWLSCALPMRRPRPRPPDPSPSGRARERSASADAVQQRLRTPSGSARAPSAAAPPATLRRAQANTGPSSALKVKFRKLTTPVAVPLELGRVRFLDHRVGQHRGARRDARDEAERRTAGRRRRGRRGSRRGSASSSEARRRRSPACAARSGPRSKPSSGQPMIQPSGTVAERITADA